MLAAFVYIAFAGLMVGALFVIGQQGGVCGWILLTVPVSAISVGVPTAIIFHFLLPHLPSPIFRLHGSWRAIIIGATIGISAAMYLLHASRNPGVRRRFSELAGPPILFTSVGSILGAFWGVAN